MTIPDHIHKCLENSMSVESNEDLSDDTVSGSMADVLRADPALAASRAPSSADSWYVKRVLAPIAKRAQPPENDRAMRDITPWHLIPQVLNALARLELTRLKVVEEATKMLELNEQLKKEPRDDVLLLPSEKKRELRKLIHPKSCETLQQNYKLMSIQTRIIHIYEDIRARASDVDELIISYFPQDLTAPTSHLFIHSMRSASADEIKSYTAIRKSVYELYRDVDEWEDQLKETISESVLNGLPQDENLNFSYQDVFDKRFPPKVSWPLLLTLILAWCRSVQDQVNALEKIFK